MRPVVGRSLSDVPFLAGFEPRRVDSVHCVVRYSTSSTLIPLIPYGPQSCRRMPVYSLSLLGGSDRRNYRLSAVVLSDSAAALSERERENSRWLAHTLTR